MAHRDKHQKYVEGCFGCKVQTLNFGTVPGGYRWMNSTSNYDPDLLPDFPSKEEVMQARSDVRNAPLKEMKLENGRVKEK